MSDPGTPPAAGDAAAGSAHAAPAGPARSHPEPARTASGEPVRTVPEATVARLAVYLRVLTSMSGPATVSSEALATAAGVNPAKLRKDLSYLGSIGTRGVGYHVDVLRERISTCLGVTVHRAVVLVGIGNLGHALAGYHGFRSRGFRIAGLFDGDRLRVGELISGLYVRAMDDLEQVVTGESVSIAVIATPAEAAQSVCDRLVAAGVTSILNFAPVLLSVPHNVDVRKVDLAVELQILSFHEQRKAAGLEVVG